jgi:hypothetical protein
MRWASQYKFVQDRIRYGPETYELDKLGLPINKHKKYEYLQGSAE